MLLFASGANAQLFKLFGQDIGYIYAGPKVGGAFSKMTNTEKSFTTNNKGDVKYRTGFQFGIVNKIGITSKFSIQPEFIFCQKGVQVKSNGVTSKYKTSYIGIPILAKYALAQVGVVKIHVNGGVYANARTSGEVEWKDPGGTSSQPLDKTGWRRLDYGFALGGGFEYQKEKGIWVFDIRYDFSVVDAHKSDATFNSNKTFGISVSYLFDFVDLYFKATDKKKDEEKKEETQSKENPVLKVDRSKE